MPRRKTFEEFVYDARLVHGDRYDYSKVEYVNNLIKVCIICSEHGEFWQNPHNHLIGQGCPSCGGKLVSDNKTFILYSNKIHNRKYDYSKVVYKSSRENVIITCPIHGDFFQRPNNHLMGQGCPKCGGYVKKTRDEFVERAKKIHHDKYNYSKVEYLTCKEKVCIICPIHGEFWQTPDKHLKGCGCSSCSESKLEMEVANFLNEKNIKFERQKTFSWLGRQRLDFYLPDYNVAIECQGEQHFKPVDFAGKGLEWATKKFLECRECDKVKKKRCVENDVRLLYYTNVESPIELFSKEDMYYSCDDMLFIIEERNVIK